MAKNAEAGTYEEGELRWFNTFTQREKVDGLGPQRVKLKSRQKTQEGGRQHEVQRWLASGTSTKLGVTFPIKRGFFPLVWHKRVTPVKSGKFPSRTMSASTPRETKQESSNCCVGHSSSPYRLKENTNAHTIVPRAGQIEVVRSKPSIKNSPTDKDKP